MSQDLTSRSKPQKSSTFQKIDRNYFGGIHRSLDLLRCDFWKIHLFRFFLFIWNVISSVTSGLSNRAFKNDVSDLLQRYNDFLFCSLHCVSLCSALQELCLSWLRSVFAFQKPDCAHLLFRLKNINNFIPLVEISPRSKSIWFQYSYSSFLLGKF